MAPRKTGKPQAQQDEEDYDNHDQNAAPKETLDSFLRDIHQISTVSIEEDAPPSGDTLPSLGWLKDHFKTKSATIRYLTITRAFPISKVAKHLGLKYQHVRNVSTQTLKRGPNEDFHLKEGQAVRSFQNDED